jgi:hypothetical protein
LTWLLQGALKAEQLVSFFRAHRKQLMLAGHSKQNLPANQTEAMRWIVKFPDRAIVIFAGWLAKQPKDYPETLASQLVPRFKAIEVEGVEFSREELTKLFRCGLDDLYGKSPSPDWLEFLSKEEGAEPESVELPASAAEPEQPSESVLEAFVHFVRGEAAADAIGDPKLKLAALLTEAAKKADPAVVGLLVPDIEVMVNLRALLMRPPIQTAAERPYPGMKASAPSFETLDPARNYLDLEIIATCRRTVATRHSFLEIEGFVGEEGVFTLSAADVRLAVPDEGRLILHPDSPVPTPTIGQPATYQVERTDTQKSIKARVVGSGRPLVRIVYVPYESREHDFVRQWIETFARESSLTTALFVTTDGLCIRPRVEPLQRVAHVSFDWILDAYSEITTIEFAAGAYVLGPLPALAKPYDCAPLVVSARRFFKTLVDRKAIRATRQQIAEIVELNIGK